MRYPKEYKEQARQRLVEGGARLAKKRGFAAAGVDDLAAAAGVTSGAVPARFCEPWLVSIVTPVPKTLWATRTIPAPRLSI